MELLVLGVRGLRVRLGPGLGIGIIGTGMGELGTGMRELVMLDRPGCRRRWVFGHHGHTHVRGAVYE